MDAGHVVAGLIFVLLTALAIWYVRNHGLPGRFSLPDWLSGGDS